VEQHGPTGKEMKIAEVRRWFRTIPLAIGVKKGLNRPSVGAGCATKFGIREANFVASA
jgi:hypothetical protein